jgi:hypothetical protein
VLNSIDILIGFSVIMLMVSMSVTLINQWILTLLGMRGKKLLDGVQSLLSQVAPGVLTADYARTIAEQVLKHPLSGRGGKKLAEVIQREDLVKIVLEIGAAAAANMPQPAAAAAAAGGAPALQPPNQPAGTPPSAAEQALVRALIATGISDPGATLRSVRMFSMRLEASQPELATHVREAKAVIMEAESQFVAQINGWFDQTMDSVSHSFAKYSHYWTVAISLILAFGLQIDALKIVNRLAVDDNLRAKLVEQSQTVQPPPAQPAPADTNEKLQELSRQTRENVAQLQELASAKLVTWPPYGGDWWKGWQQSSFFGVLLAGMLISLGAPFWFNTLGNLLKLRPGLAAKEDQQRAERQTTQSAPAASAEPPAGGERGDPTAG